VTPNAIIQCSVYFGLLILLSVPLGIYMARVFSGRALIAKRLLGPLERLIYRLTGVDPDAEMGWKTYTACLLFFNFFGFVLLYVLQRIQGILPLNPGLKTAVMPDIAFNTAVSFVTNTNWQAYSGEIVMSHLVQMTGLTVQNFVSAATGMAVLLALARGFTRKNSETVGNFWSDLVKTVVYVLLPLSIILSLVLVSQGVVQTFKGAVIAKPLESLNVPAGTVPNEQIISVGPVASQVAIKQLGTNGGGFYNANSAHPFENPTPLSNFLEMLAILLIPAAQCFMFGILLGDRRQGWALFTAMAIIFIPFTLTCVVAEHTPNPALNQSEANHANGHLHHEGSMEGKETRFGITNSALWAVVTTAASNGSVNSMHDSFSPVGGLVPMWLMQLGEIVFGGVGSGLYGMLMFAIVAVFISGLMIGRTPEYFGKKIESFEMKMAMVVILVTPAMVLIGTAIACVLPAGLRAVMNPGPHGFSEILYAFSSGANNNGSAFAGLDAASPFYAVSIATIMLVGRFWLIIPVMAAAGSLAKKKIVPVSSGTLPTHTPLFVILLAGVVVIVGALTYVPALALGPIIEHLKMFNN